MYSELLRHYKNHLMQDICTNETLVRLLTNDADAKAPAPELRYRQVFPYEYVPQTAEDATTYITYDVAVTRVPNKTFVISVLDIYVFSHKSLMRLDEGGIRPDMVTIELEKTLNGSRMYGLGELDLVLHEPFSPIEDYYGRHIRYTANDFNRVIAHKPIPAKRGV